MTSTFQVQIDAGLIEDPGECVHGWPAGSACPYCENDRIRSDLLAVQERMDDALEVMNKLDIHLRELRFERFKEKLQCQK